MKVTYALPAGIRGFRYVPNHHYIELEDGKGQVVHMPATSLLRVDCAAGHSFYVTFNSGTMTCPHCGATTTMCWGRLQVAFVPETESNFTPPVQAADPAEPPEEEPGA